MNLNQLANIAPKYLQQSLDCPLFIWVESRNEITIKMRKKKKVGKKKMKTKLSVLLSFLFSIIYITNCQLENDDPHFDIKFLNKDQQDLISTFAKSSMVQMKSNGLNYDCYLPEIKEPIVEAEQNVSINLEPFFKFLTTNCLIKV